MKQRKSMLCILVTTGFTVLALVGIDAGQEPRLAQSKALRSSGIITPLIAELRSAPARDLKSWPASSVVVAI